jgi:peptidyl-prolyl cis-trans isomerase C
MRFSFPIAALALAASLLGLPALAQPAGSLLPAAPPPPSPSTVLATVNGHPILMSDIQAAAANLPAQVASQIPQDQMFPLLLNQQIDRLALLNAAQNEKLQNDPQIAAAMQEAANEKLENAYLQQKVTPQISDAAIQAEYNKDYAGKPGAAQVDARHILVKTQAEAQDIINQLNHGADFAKLAIKYSIDPGASNGGELGWFSQNEMVPAFANAAFALKPGQYTKTPVQSQFGWHVILCEGKRIAPAPALDDTLKQQISQSLQDAAIKQTIASARANVKIVLDIPSGPPGAAPAGSTTGQ